jgi:hypothetical protein
MPSSQDYRAARYFMEKRAFTFNGAVQGAQNAFNAVKGSVANGRTGKALLGAGGGAGAGGLAGAGIGAGVGGYQSYNAAKEQGADTNTALMQGLGGAMSGGSRGAAIGAGVGGVAGGVGGAMGHNVHKWTTLSPLGNTFNPAQMGQRLVHSLTGAGAGDKAHLRNIGATYAQKFEGAASDAASALETAKKTYLPGTAQLQKAQNYADNQVKALAEAKKLDDMGGTHLPGVMSALYNKGKGPGEYLSAYGKSEWYGMPRTPFGYASTLGMPAVGVGMSLLPGAGAHDYKTDPNTGEQVQIRDPSLLRRGIRAGANAAGFLTPGMSNMSQMLGVQPALDYAGEGVANLVGA